ncbi:hypothetical protein RHMOL_Rhmol12G0035500 [Rhododendron molle]|uniref:Uncharacterized protein n=1 Tax=Rhododendron molle TaxID=49168 RepID=A0ACC0LFJ3_RHOML|nr:hypothetical protein RHMOL_Rhmol12G0035500 [Rhododendron molle]
MTQALMKWDFKKKGVYKGPTNARDAKTHDQSSHAVLVVGYGVENGVEYYTIKNSWWVDWGDGGYGKIKRSLFESFCYPIEKGLRVGTTPE